jgi:pyruvate-ferredoxin/flavodoxin oxidoreductase
MAERPRGIGWLRRLWQRTGATSIAPGSPALLPVEAAIAALETQICDGIVHDADVPASAAGARRAGLPGPPVCNQFGRPVAEEFAASARDRIAVATGMALAGLRSTAFLAGDELAGAAEALRGCAERRAPLVAHVFGAAAHHAACAAVAETGCFQVLASSGQEALDWTLVARVVAERALVPGLVVNDVAAIERLHLPDAATLLATLGRAEEPIPSPTEAQRILFGAERTRLLPWFDPDHPVATGGLRGRAETARAGASGYAYFWEPLAELLSRAMTELSEHTGRPLHWLQTYGLDDAEVVLVTRGSGVQTARAVADLLRRTRHLGVGVLGVPWLRPFPAAALAQALSGRHAVAVIEPLGAAAPGGAPLFREITAAVGGGDGWISASCGSDGPEPAALVSLCELLRARERPVRVDLERTALPGSSGFPRREALLQALANADPRLREADLPAAAVPATAWPPDRSAALVGLEAALPPDALALLAEAVTDDEAGAVRGAQHRPEPGVLAAQARAAARDFPDPGPRAGVSLLLVATDGWSRLGDPFATIAPGGTALLATARSPEQLWSELPERWRHTLRERELLLFAVAPEFAAAMAALATCLREGSDAARARGTLREIPASPPAAAADRAVPALLRRIPRARPTHDSLPRFWGEVVQPRQVGGDDGVADPLTASGAVPAAASALQPASAATTLPAFDPAACSGCGRCWSACPDSAIGATALGAEALLSEASRIAGTTGAAADALRRSHKHLAERLTRKLTTGDAAHAHVAGDDWREAWSWLRERLKLDEEAAAASDLAIAATLAVIENLEPVASEPLFGAPEQAAAGDGALLVLAIDPDACLGCGLCSAHCPDGALADAERTPERVAEAERRWRTWEGLPDTPGAVVARASAHPDVGPLAGVLLSRHCGRAQLGGGDGEPGSGERLAGRLVTALIEHAAQRRAAELARRLAEAREQLEQKVREGLGEGLTATDFETLQAALGSTGGGRGDLSDFAHRLDALGSRARFDRRALQRTAELANNLARRHRDLVHGCDGLGRARFGVVVARGGAADWAARYPGHPWFAPLTLAPTAEGVELARGIAHGLVAEHLAALRDLRRAAVELEAPPDLAARLDSIDALAWEDLAAEERAACPPLLLLGDDRALLAEGFEAFTRLLASELPVKVLLLDGRGRLAPGPEPALVAMAHRRAFVLAASPAHPTHLARGVADAMTWPGPALLHLYAASPRRHGFASNATLERSRLAVESRAHVLLRYDPAAAGVFGLRASLDGNPAPEEIWGEIDFAAWAAGEERFAEHFGPVENGGALPFRAWLDLPEEQRGGCTPEIEWDGDRLAVGAAVARAAAERASVWGALRELTGGTSPFTAKLREALAAEQAAEHGAELETLRAEYEARLAEARSGADADAIDRLTAQLLSLSGFAGEAAPPGDGS